MKNIGKRTKSILALLLAAIMLFGITVPTVSAASESEFDFILNFKQAADESTSETLDLDWVTIVCHKDTKHLEVVLSPTAESLSGVSKDQLQSLLDMLKDAINTLIIDQIKENVKNPDSEDSAGDMGSATADTIWHKALESYIINEYDDSVGDLDDKYMKLFEELLDKDVNGDITDVAASRAQSIVDYVCGKISLAVSVGVIALEDLPPVDESLADTLNEKFDEFLEGYIMDRTELAIEDYIAALQLDGVFTPEGRVESYIVEHIDDYLHNMILAYIAHRSDEAAEQTLLDYHFGRFYESVISKVVGACYDFGTGAITESELLDMLSPLEEAVLNHTDSVITSESVGVLTKDELIAKVKDYYESDVSELAALLDVFEARGVDGEFLYLKEIVLTVMPALATYDSDGDGVMDNDEVITDIATDENLLDDVLIALFGVSDAQLRDRVAFIIDEYLMPDYDALYQELSDREGFDIDYKELIKELNAIIIDPVVGGEVDGESIYSGGALNKDEIKKLLRDLPTVSELAEMDTLYLDWEIMLGTREYGDCIFSFSVEVTEGMSYVNRAAAFLRDHVEFSVDGSTVNLSVKMPEAVSDFLLQVANSDKISTSVKNKIFRAATGTIDDLIDFYDSFTFDDLVEILDNIDVDRIINKISQYVDVTRFRDEVNQIIAKVKTQEDRFNRYKNKAKTYIDKAYGLLPDRFKSMNLLDTLYESSLNGSGYFAVNETINMGKLEATIRDAVDGYNRLESLVVFGFGLVDIDSFTANVSVAVPNLAKVEYKFSDSAKTRKGLLPAGADVGMFANYGTDLGREIIGWRTADGTVVTEMPSRDVVLYPILGNNVDFEIVHSENLDYDGSVYSFTFDGDTRSLAAVYHAAGTLVNPEISYEWYKGGVLVSSTDVVSLSKISDSGTYTYRITVTDEFSATPVVKEGSVTVAVSEPAAPNVDSPITDADGNHVGEPVDGVYEFTYSPDGRYVITAIIEDGYPTGEGAVRFEYRWYKDNQAISCTEEEITISSVADSGTYYCEITVYYGGEQASEKITTEPVTVRINKAVISVGDIWNEAVNIYGQEYNVFNTDYAELVSVTGESESAVGNYVAEAIINDSFNYVFSDGNAVSRLEWCIIPKLNVSAPSYVGGAYTGEEYTANVSVMAEGGVSFDATEVKWQRVINGTATDIDGADGLSYSVINVSESGTYRCVVTVYSDDMDGNAVAQTAFCDVELNVTPFVINLSPDASEYVWSNLGHTYNGQSYTPDFTNNNLPDYVIADYGTVLSNTRPGAYSVTATLSVVSDNYVFRVADGTPYDTSSIDRVITYTIDKAEGFDYSKIKWNSDTLAFYYTGDTDNPFEIALTGYESFTFGDIVVRYSNDSTLSAVEVGSYTATVEGIWVLDGGQLYNVSDYYYVENEDRPGFVPSVEWGIYTSVKTVHIYDKNGIYVRVDDKAGVLSEYEIFVSLVNVGEQLNLTNGKTVDVIMALDIIFKDADGNPFVYTGRDNFVVTIRVPDAYQGKSVKVVYVGNGGINRLVGDAAFTSDMQYITFTTDHFSVYAFAMESTAGGEVTPPDDGGDDPIIPPDDDKGGVSEITAVIAIVIGAVLLVLLLIILTMFIGSLFKRKQHKHYPDSDETADLYDVLRCNSWRGTRTVRLITEEPKSAEVSSLPVMADTHKSVINIRVKESKSKQTDQHVVVVKATKKKSKKG